MIVHRRKDDRITLYRNNNELKGVYILYKYDIPYMQDISTKDKIVYIGHGNIYGRLNAHCKDKDWDYCFIIPIDDKSERLSLESFLINLFIPKYNKAIPSIHNIGDVTRRLQEKIFILNAKLSLFSQDEIDERWEKSKQDIYLSI